MRAALKDSYIDFVIYMGMTEKYPLWFENELNECTYTDESRFTFWVNREDRRPDYYEKKLIEDYTVILRNANGELHITDYDVFQNLYITFRYDAFTNSGIAAFESDTIDYVECTGGMLSVAYPDWFYEYFTEAVNFPNGETMFFRDKHRHKPVVERGPFMEIDKYGGVSVDDHCVFLRNKLGEIKGMLYSDFIKFYDDDPDKDPTIWG